MSYNIIFVLLDGARTDRLFSSDKFLELSKYGKLFSNVITSAPYTFASINSIFTGLHGKDNGVDAYYNMFKLKDSVNFLPEVLQKNGYYTSCDLISEKVISKRGFDQYDFHDEYNDDLMLKHTKLIKNSFKLANGKPIFCFLQYSHIHTITVSEILKKHEWDDQEYYKKKEKNLIKYDQAFQKSGEYANKIYDTIQKLGKSDETIIIFFSDHGTGIGERFGERNYGVFLYEETIRTFYLFIGPNLLKNNSSDLLLSNIDLFSTILDLCDIEITNNTQSESFVSHLKNENTDNTGREFVFSATGGLQGPHPSPNKPNVFCIKTHKYKLVLQQSNKTWYLFDLEKDPNELNNLHDTGLSIQSILSSKLLSWIKAEYLE